MTTCNHDNCYTCPYPDCISNVEVEPERKKPGRKKLTPAQREERKAAEKIKRHERWLREKDSCHEQYMIRTEGKVTKRYKIKKRKKEHEV